MRKWFFSVLGLIFAVTLAYGQPQLPSGLGAPSSLDQAPTLPQGLSRPSSSGNLTTPPGDDTPTWTWQGFAETRSGQRLNDDPNQSDQTLAEIRLQLALDVEWPEVYARISGDVIADARTRGPYNSPHGGQRSFDVREAWLQGSWQAVDFKVGRQILTWGVGDLLFINDLFPKDWHSFIVGRGQAYLKAPADTFKLTYNQRALAIDVVWSPEFASDRYIDGRGVSFYNPVLGRITGLDAPLNPQPNTQDTWALRLYGTHQGIEKALYAYRGYWPSPVGFAPQRMAFTFPKLDVFGASWRQAFAQGVLSSELGWYRSVDDTAGRNPFIPNSQVRWLIGYEQEIVRNLTMAWQYYIEHRQNHSAYVSALTDSSTASPANRQLLTQRLTWLNRNQTIEASLFIFYDLTNKDWHARPRLSWQLNDHLHLQAGLNLFAGKPQDFFGQFDQAENVFVAVRYSF